MGYLKGEKERWTENALKYVGKYRGTEEAEGSNSIEKNFLMIFCMVLVLFKTAKLRVFHSELTLCCTNKYFKQYK
jgi:hypothetical protein